MTAILRADSIGKAFGGRHVLKAAYFEVRAGEAVGVVGRNGAGKSTLLKIAAGWLAPDHGLVEFRGKRYVRPPAAQLARAGLLYLPVDRSVLSPVFTLGQHLDALEHRFGRTSHRAGTLEALGISHLQGVLTSTLSDGERRRAELAVAVLRRPRCLLLDEPFRGVDPVDREVITEILHGLTESGSGLAITGHEMESVLGAAQLILWVREGSTELLGSPANATAHWRFRRDYLGLAPLEVGPGGA